MPDVVYVGLQDDDKIVRFGINAGAGKLVPRGETPAAGAPSVFAVSPDRRVLYVGYRGAPAIESCRIDSSSGALTSLGRVSTEHPPTYLATDRTGQYLLSAPYQGAYAAVHPLGSDGAVSGPALDRQNTAPGAHAILTDPSNPFAFVPHIARPNDTVLEPPKNIPGPNFIAHFRFDAWERSPAAREGVTVRNTCSQIHLTPSGRFLYVGNRGHNSIAGFAVGIANIPTLRRRGRHAPWAPSSRHKLPDADAGRPGSPMPQAAQPRGERTRVGTIIGRCLASM